MELQNAIDKYFSRDYLASSICKYQLYYQIGLGKLALESLQDLQETFEKLEELNLHLSTEQIIITIYKMILQLSHNANFEKMFDTHLKYTALVQMLSDFIKADKELINSKPFEDMIFESIQDDTFFDDIMQQQFDINYKAILPSVKLNITQETADSIKNNISEMFSQIN